MKDILELNIGLTIGLINEKNNQIIDLNINRKDNDEDKVIVGNANMLKGM